MMMKIPIQVNGKLIKNVAVPEGLSTKQEYDFLYAALYNDIDIRAAVGLNLKAVVHVLHKSVNLLTKESQK